MRTSLAAWSSTFLAALSLPVAACSSSVQIDAGASGSGAGTSSSATSGVGSTSAVGGATGTSANTSSIAAGGSPMAAPPCVYDTPLVVDGQPTGFATCGNDGTTHRPTKQACPNGLPREFTCADTEGCITDADCTGAPNGFCSDVPAYGVCSCLYGCLTDADCGANEICECGAPVGVCVAASCKSDADCGEDLLCASYDTNPSCGPIAFACQRYGDQCLTKADCPSNGIDDVCSISDGQRVCTVAACQLGRPFLIDGASVVAKLAYDDGWRGQVGAVASLSPDLARLAAAHWTKNGLMEHASIAAFARFALDLVSLGAPADLLIETQRAMGDEIEHARVAFALAGRFGGRAVGPGAMTIDGAMEHRTHESILRDTILEGCIGEAVAALEAEEAAKHAVDPEVRAQLEKVAEDERRHALLAYRFVAWSIERDASLADVFLAEALASRASLSRAQANPVGDAVLLTLGIVPDSMRADLRRHVVETIVLPTARAFARPLAA